MSDLPVPVEPSLPVPTPEGVVGWVIVNGAKWVVKKIGEKILKRFLDEDGDGVPDNPDDEGEVINLPTDVSYIMVNPDGTMVIYDSSGQITAENVDTAYSLWVSENGIMNKRVDNYSVTEALLAAILLFTFLNFVRGLFRRSDYFK